MTAHRRIDHFRPSCKHQLMTVSLETRFHSRGLQLSDKKRPKVTAKHGTSDFHPSCEHQLMTGCEIIPVRTKAFLAKAQWRKSQRKERSCTLLVFACLAFARDC